MTSVEDYAAFMISVMNAEGYSANLAAKRNGVQIEVEFADCDSDASDPCPASQGYGLGWRILDYDTNNLIWHGGSDWSEVAVAAFYTRSHDGFVIFFNAPNGRALAAMPKAIEAIDPDSPLPAIYRTRVRE